MPERAGRALAAAAVLAAAAAGLGVMLTGKPQLAVVALLMLVIAICVLYIGFQVWKGWRERSGASAPARPPVALPPLPEPPVGGYSYLIAVMSSGGNLVTSSGTTAAGDPPPGLFLSDQHFSSFGNATTGDDETQGEFQEG